MDSCSSPGSDEWRFVVIGKTGSGKSSAANTILGKEAFVSEVSATSVTIECKKARGEVGGKKLSVIDTPGLFDTSLTHEEVWKEISMCIGMSAPGPHAFLVVVQVGRFTDEEKQTVTMIQEMFGKDADKCTMLLFTFGDKLKKKTIEEFVSESKDLQAIIQKCHGRYHVFNNEANNLSQVTDLLEKIDKMIKINGETYYTTKMYQKAEEDIQKEKERILKESEAQRKKEEDGLKAKYAGKMLEIEKQNKRLRDEAQARAQAETKITVPRKRCVIL